MLKWVPAIGLGMRATINNAEFENGDSVSVEDKTLLCDANAIIFHVRDALNKRTGVIVYTSHGTYTSPWITVARQDGEGDDE